MQLGLNPQTNEAVSLWNLDPPMPDEAMGAVRPVPAVARALAVRLG